MSTESNEYYRYNTPKPFIVGDGSPGLPPGVSVPPVPVIIAPNTTTWNPRRLIIVSAAPVQLAQLEPNRRSLLIINEGSINGYLIPKVQSTYQFQGLILPSSYGSYSTEHPDEIWVVMPTATAGAPGIVCVTN